MNKRLLRILATPLAALFGLGVELRLFLYRSGIFKRTSFSLPTVVVGNLSVGGAGKTPHVEYLLRYLSAYLPVAALSRGYGRKTSGFRMVDVGDSAVQSGDEPLQIKRKFPDIPVAVSENRVNGISQLLQRAPATRVIVLDDAFQHLAVRAGLYLLLTEYDRPYTEDQLMPVGRLREWSTGANRADAIVVTKCPPELSPAQRSAFIDRLDPLPEQRVFFSRYVYGRPWLVFDARYSTSLQADWDVLLVTAIARVDYLLAYVREQVREVHELSFGDHHNFTRHDIARMVRLFREIDSPNKIILTTEKDAMRLHEHRAYLEKQNLPLFALPLAVEFFPEPPGREFDAYLQHQLLSFRA